jgi:hypothetical protein
MGLPPPNYFRNALRLNLKTSISTIPNLNHLKFRVTAEKEKKEPQAGLHQWPILSRFQNVGWL